MTFTENLPCLYPATSERVYKIHERLLMRNLRAYAEYEAEEKRWYRHGDGRPSSEGGLGYAFPSCIHGVSRWVDYDCACGACEDGYGYWDAAREFNDAYIEAVGMVNEYEERVNLVLAFVADIRLKVRSELPYSVKYDLFKWALEPVA